MDPDELLLLDDDNPAMPSATATVNPTLKSRRLRVRVMIGFLDASRPDRSSLIRNGTQSVGQ